jgi:hypothetical protein
MVQIYDPNIVREQIFIDAKNIYCDKVNTMEIIKIFRDKVIEETNQVIVGECSYQFETFNAPYGPTSALIHVAIFHFIITTETRNLRYLFQI